MSQQYSFISDDKSSNQQGKSMNRSKCFLMKESEIARQKKRAIKKILLISSIDIDDNNDNEISVVKIFLRILQNGPSFATTEVQNQLMNVAKGILDDEKKTQVKQYLQAFADDEDPNPNNMNFDLLMKIIKFFVLSPVEKQYINKIEQELQNSEQMDLQIMQLQEQIQLEKNKKIQKYKEDKGFKETEESKMKQRLKKSFCKDPTTEAMLREIKIHENKLEKANQKLNQIVTNNNNLREKINKLRKEKNIIEDISNKLKSELENKKKIVQETILQAGDAFWSRNKAEEELKNLHERQEKYKEEFDNESQQLNQNINNDKKYRDFIKSKAKEKEQVKLLEKEIYKNQQIIREKKETIANIDKEYELTESKETLIKSAFNKLKQEMGFSSNSQQDTVNLLLQFTDLNQKNQKMQQLVDELQEEVKNLDASIQQKKVQLQDYSTRGATFDNSKREEKIGIMLKLQQDESRKQILKQQFQISIQTIDKIKEYLAQIFKNIEIDDKIIEDLKICANTQENLAYYLGILEQKGLQSLILYARLLAEQMSFDKKKENTHLQFIQQIEDLNNIIAFENANIMNYYTQANNYTSYSGNQQSKIPDAPDDLFKDEQTEEGTLNTNQNEDIFDGKQKLMDMEEFKKIALQTIQKKMNQQQQLKPMQTQQRNKQVKQNKNFNQKQQK